MCGALPEWLKNWEETKSQSSSTLDYVSDAHWQLIKPAVVSLFNYKHDDSASFQDSRFFFLSAGKMANISIPLTLKLLEIGQVIDGNSLDISHAEANLKTCCNYLQTSLRWQTTDGHQECLISVSDKHILVSHGSWNQTETTSTAH